ncbi:MAG: glycosyltransferase family 39 protein [Candidatus Solibacter sp.]|nr:glycosyltransferase family 39 protein [Candidatus Solibacter sp.]
MQALAILFGAAFTCAVSLALGRLLLGDACRDLGIRFVSGAAVLSLLVCALCGAGLVYPAVLLAMGFLAMGAAVLEGRVSRAGEKRVQGDPPHQQRRFTAIRILWGIAFGMYLVLYLSNAMAPEASPDGAAYHLGLVSRYLREHGFVRITDNLYAAMPGGVEMLFLFAFAFGKHSAAALVHFAFLVALVWQVFSYARRRGFPVAGASAALLVFASPVVGIDGTSAYNDVAVAAIAFTLFHLLQLWDEERNPRLLAAIGLVAGFAFTAKYSAWPAVAYAVGFVLVKAPSGAATWRVPRSGLLCCSKAVLPVAACAAVVIAPWLLKNWVYVHNPVAPFFNRQFPNPYIMTGFEDIYRRMMAMYHLKSRWEIPLQVTMYGTVSGLLGPVFLLAPLGLLALRRREGRQLWLAALVFGVNYFSNIATRFLIPPLPFVALALALALSAVPHLAVAVAVLSAALSWPAVVGRYAQAHAWRLHTIPWREALRIRPEERYLEAHLEHYGVDRLIEQKAAPGSTVFTFVPIPEAYTSRHIRVEYQSAANQIAGKLLWTAAAPEYAPTWRLRFRFPRQTLRGLRVVQGNRGEETWSIHEFRIYHGEQEVTRAPEWSLTAQPYPWGIQDAFDNSLATFWLCGETLKAGQFVQVDFHGERTADSVELEAAPNQGLVQLKLEGQDAAGHWQMLAAEPTPGDAPRPLGLRRAVASELKRRGIDYLLVFDTDNGADDLRLNADLWGMRAVGDYRGARLYQLL